ncbi:MAG: hypothetical protein ABIT82_03775 [Ramlibacter sp.]
MLILLAMLVIPVWLKSERDDKEAAMRKKEEAAARGSARPVKLAPVAVAVAADTAVLAQPPARTIGHGLTFGAVASGPAEPRDVAHIGCHGDPRQFDQPHKNSCNPYKGDTSCRVVLPVLCVRQDGAPVPPGVDSGFYKGWTGGTLGATQPVMGAILESLAAASARCERELGAGWRMAEFHDGQGGWGLQGKRGSGLNETARFWVHINDQKGNCWDSAP